MIDRIEISSGGRRIVGNLFTHNGRRNSIVILLHGFLSSKEDLFFVAEALQKQGIDSLAIDMNGHGESDGNFSDFTISGAVDDCRAAIDYAISQGFSNIGIFGFSIGGFVALNIAKQLQHKGHLKALVLGAPVSSFSDTFSWADLQAWKSTGIFRSDKLGISIKMGYKFYEDGIALDGYKKFSSIETPTLILHGTKDNIVPLRQSEELARYLRNVHLIRVNGASHSLFTLKGGDEALDSLIKWFKAYL
ncbi:MAG: alpha/beta fold hydrolase [Candidatus Micrarchaeia archaeon]